MKKTIAIKNFQYYYYYFPNSTFIQNYQKCLKCDVYISITIICLFYGKKTNNFEILTNFNSDWDEIKFLTLQITLCMYVYLVHASRDIRRLVKGLQCCSFLLWTCWKSGVVLEINFKFLNFLQMCFCRIVGSSKNTFWSFGKWERES